MKNWRGRAEQRLGEKALNRRGRLSLAAYGYLRSLQPTGDVARDDCGRAFPQAPTRLSPALAGLFFAEMSQ
jgi:hypothetical protein